MDVAYKGFLSGIVVKNLPVMQELQETQIRYLGQEDPLEEGMATHSNILAWRIPWTQEPGGLWSIELRSIGWQRVRHFSSDLACMQSHNRHLTYRHEDAKI